MLVVRVTTRITSRVVGRVGNLAALWCFLFVRWVEKWCKSIWIVHEKSGGMDCTRVIESALVQHLCLKMVQSLLLRINYLLLLHHAL